jgi:two-component system chemotaxis response regulator CheB
VPGHDIVVVGGSAGAIEALKKLVSGLTKEFPAAVFVVVHVWPEAKSMLPEILSRSGPLPAAHARDGESIQPGRIYVAVPDCHLLLKHGEVNLRRGPKENLHRPAVDPLFRSAALAYGPRVIGVILSGGLDDGTAGLLAVKRHGGIAVVQDPSTAGTPGMPASACENVDVDHILPVSEIAPLLMQLAHERVREPVTAVAEPEEPETGVAMGRAANAVRFGADEPPGKPSAYACPECHGVLFEVEDRDFLRFRCRVGHAYSEETLSLELSSGAEAALWAGLRALEENAALERRLASRAKARNHLQTAEQFARKAEDRETSARVIGELLLHVKQVK